LPSLTSAALNVVDKFPLCGRLESFYAPSDTATKVRLELDPLFQFVFTVTFNFFTGIIE